MELKYLIGDRIEYSWGSDYSDMSYGVCLDNVIRINGEEYLKIARGYEKLEDFCYNNIGQMNEGYNILPDKEIVYITIQQVNKLSRTNLILNVEINRLYTGELDLIIRSSDIEYIITQFPDGKCFLQKIYSTTATSEEVMSYSEKFIKYISSENDKKFINIFKYNKIFDRTNDLRLYTVSKASSTRTANGNFIYTLRSINQKAFYIALPLKLEIGQTIFLDFDNYKIVVRPFEDTDTETALTKKYMLSWIYRK